MLVPRQGHHRYAQEAIVASRATPVVDSVEVYWQQIKNTEPLSRAQEVDLFTRAKAGDEDARQQIIECNLRFVVSVARQYRDYGLSLSELISEGNVGLMEGAKRFDETRGLQVHHLRRLVDSTGHSQGIGRAGPNHHTTDESDQ